MIWLTVKGEMNFKTILQALFEMLSEIEEEYHVRHAFKITLYLRPSNGAGKEITLPVPDARPPRFASDTRNADAGLGRSTPP